MAHSCRSLSHFCSMKWLEVFLLSLNLQVTPPQFVRFPQQFASTHLYTWVERDTVRVECLAQEHVTQCQWPGLEPGPLAPESNALTMRPPSLPHNNSLW